MTKTTHPEHDEGRASLELCKELYELSGWDDAYLRWVNFKEPRVVNADEWARNMDGVPDAIVSGDSVYMDQIELTPAYDLGYLLRKLPEMVLQSRWRLPPSITGERFPDDALVWEARHYKVKNIVSVDASADTPEDAACKLAIELIKQGVLKP